MTEERAVRLDAAVWTPSPLGMLGPPGLLGDLSGGGTTYRPLLSYHLAEGPLADGLDRAVALVESHAALVELLDSPDVAPWRSPGTTAGDEDRWNRERRVAIVLRDRVGDRFQGLLGGGLTRNDPRIAHVTTFWVPNAAWLRAGGVDDILAAGWLLLFRGLAARGAVGVTATETWSGRDFVDVQRRIGGFRPTAEVYGALGLSPADEKAVLAEWRATIDQGRVLRFATRPDLDPAARDDLFVSLARYLDAAPWRPEPAGEAAPAPAGRVTLDGEIRIDGPAGWGMGGDRDDWYGAPPDHLPDGGDAGDISGRAVAALAAWLHDQVVAP